MLDQQRHCDRLALRHVLADIQPQSVDDLAAAIDLPADQPRILPDRFGIVRRAGADLQFLGDHRDRAQRGVQLVRRAGGERG